jgi:hypothetical protein
MDANPITNTKYQQVTVDVPEDRMAEFHAFFGRFLAGSAGRTRRGRHGRPHRAGHGHGCAGRRQVTERDEAIGQPAETTQV